MGYKDTDQNISTRSLTFLIFAVWWALCGRPQPGRPLSRGAATFQAGTNQIRLAHWPKFGWRRRNSTWPREWRHITLLVSLSMEHVVSTASVVTVGYFGSQNGANLGKWGSKYLYITFYDRNPEKAHPCAEPCFGIFCVKIDLGP